MTLLLRRAVRMGRSRGRGARRGGGLVGVRVGIGRVVVE